MGGGIFYFGGESVCVLVWVLNLCLVCGCFEWIGYDLVAVILLLCYFVSIGNLVWLCNGVVVMYECYYVGLWVEHFGWVSFFYGHFLEGFVFDR